MSFERHLKKSKAATAVARFLLRPLPDVQYLALRYFVRFGRWPDYDNPRDFNECMHAYMLRCRDPRLKLLADKQATREYVREHAGPQYLIPSYGVWNDAESVPLPSLPRPFVLKATVGNSMNCFVREGDSVDERRLRRTIRNWLRIDFSRVNREWAYRDLPQKVIAERMLLTEGDGIPEDIKVYVVGRRARFIQVDRNRFGNHTRNLYNPEWQLIPVRLTKQNHSADPRPSALDEMVHLAERLAAPFEFLRVDYYALRGQLYIGELTSYSGAGFETFIPATYGEQLAAWWHEGVRRHATGKSVSESIAVGPRP